MNRKIYDFILQLFTYLAASIGVIILLLIISFVFIRGYKAVDLGLILNRYHSEPFWIRYEFADKGYSRPSALSEDIYWSTKWGVGIIETKNRDKEDVIRIEYIAKDSPLQYKGIIYQNSSNKGATEDKAYIDVGYTIKSYKTDFPQPATNANDVIKAIEQQDYFFVLTAKPAGGIRGPIITTLMIIGLTLAIATPFGISIALYLTEYARKNKVVFAMRSMIDMLAGVPSIVFGIFGMLIFFRYFKIGTTSGYSIIGGALTLVAVILPVVIRSTEEALLTVPDEMRQGSYALGANKLQTIIKIVIPSSLPGIMTAVLLSIGRIIGESAALILVAGTFINDEPRLRDSGATLAVQIWKIMAGEQPNIELASAISLIIIVIVLILNILVKLSSKYLNRAKV